MGDDLDVADPLADAIQDAIIPKGAILIDYVIVATYHDGDHVSIVGESSGDLSPWGRDSLLNYGANKLNWEDGDEE